MGVTVMPYEREVSRFCKEGRKYITVFHPSGGGANLRQAMAFQDLAFVALAVIARSQDGTSEDPGLKYASKLAEHSLNELSSLGYRFRCEPDYADRLPKCLEPFVDFGPPPPKEA